MIARSNTTLHTVLLQEWLNLDDDSPIVGLRFSEWVVEKYGLYIEHDYWHFKDPKLETLFRLTHGHVL